MTMSEPLGRNAERRTSVVALSCFAAFSGSLVSLGLELVLARIALTSLGSTALASTVTITIYLCGLTLGALLAQYKTTSNRTITVAATTLAATPLLSLGLMQFLANTALGSPTILFLLTLALALPSSSSAALVSLLASRQRAGTSNSIYLAANLGAFSGVVLTGYVLLPHFGLTGCLVTLLAVITPATICSWFFKDVLQVEDRSATATVETFETATAKSTYLILFCTALLLTILECDWLRLSSLLLGSSSQTFAATLAFIIGGLALGNFFALKLSKSKKDAVVLPAAALTLSTLACLLSLKSVSALPTIFQVLRIYFQQFQGISEIFLAVPQQLATALLVMPTSACLGLIYPLYTGNLSNQQWRKAYTVSAAGAIVAPSIFLIALPFTSLELLLKLCILILALLTAIEAVPLLTKTKSLKPIALVFLAGSIFATVMTIFPPPLNKRMMTAGIAYLAATPEALEQIKQEGIALEQQMYKDGINSTISVEDNKALNIRILKSDGKVEATLPIHKEEAASGSDLATQTMLCVLPVLVHGGNNFRCLIVGLGSGTTSNTARALGQVKTVEVVELEPAVFLAADHFGNLEVKDVENTSHKLRYVHSDARAHLKDKQTYDLIISQPSEPWIAGSSGLFTIEFFRLVKSRLASDGLAAQWMPLYGLSESDFHCALRTFVAAFPDTLIFHQKGAGEILLIGANNSKSLERIQTNEYKDRFLSHACRKQTALAGIDSWNTFAQCHLALLGSQSAKAIGPLQRTREINTDDNMRLEFSAGRYLANIDGANEKQMQANLASIANKWQLGSLKTEPKNEASLLNAIALDQSAYLLLNVKAKNLLIEGKPELALDYLNRSKALNPSIEQTRELLALALVYLGKLEEGLQETQAAHLLNHQSCTPYLIAACIYQIEDHGTEAHLNLRKAGQICPENEILNQIAGLKINTAGILKSILIRL
ncbi:hypothetical protein BH11CYA1_BH11CYA1_17220 [soil metagenome]